MTQTFFWRAQQSDFTAGSWALFADCLTIKDNHVRSDGRFAREGGQ